MVALAGFDEGEEARTIDALTGGEDVLEVFEAVDHEVQGLQLTVPATIVEVDEFDFVFLALTDDDGASEFCCRLLKILHQTLGVHGNSLVNYYLYFRFKDLKIQDLKFKDFASVSTDSTTFASMCCGGP